MPPFLRRESTAQEVYDAFAAGVTTFPGDGVALEENAIVIGLPDHVQVPPEVSSVLGCPDRLDIKKHWFIQPCLDVLCPGRNLILELDGGAYAGVCPNENLIRWLKSLPDRYKPKGSVT